MPEACETGPGEACTEGERVEGHTLLIKGNKEGGECMLLPPSSRGVDPPGAVPPGLSVPLQRFDEKLVETAHHGPGVVHQSCRDHGVLIDLEGRAPLQPLKPASRASLPTKAHAGPNASYLIHEQLGQLGLTCCQLLQLPDERMPATQKPPRVAPAVLSPTHLSTERYWVPTLNPSQNRPHFAHL